MGQCLKCGARFVGTAANPPGDGLCSYCEKDMLRQKLKHAEDELEDNERWMREVLTDFRIQFDDHKVGRRLAFVQWMAERIHNHYAG